MKKIAIFLIEVYQKIFSSFIKNILGISYSCRFRPTCSDYAKMSIEKKGIVKGGTTAIARILKCQPMYKGYTANI